MICGWGRLRAVARFFAKKKEAPAPKVDQASKKELELARKKERRSA